LETSNDGLLALGEGHGSAAIAGHDPGQATEPPPERFVTAITKP
jgi:hypothetical protein